LEFSLQTITSDNSIPQHQPLALKQDQNFKWSFTIKPIMALITIPPEI
jgi:hypothetical protein